MMYLDSLVAMHAVDAADQLLRDACPAIVERLARADQHRLALEHRVERPKPVGFQRRAGRHEVADEARDLEPRRQLDRALHLDDLGLDSMLVEKSVEQARVGRGDALARKALRPFIGEPLGRGDSQAALAEAELGEHLEPGLGRAEREFLEHVLADDAELADAVADEGRNVVVAHEHQVGGEVRGPSAQAVPAALDPQTGFAQQARG